VKSARDTAVVSVVNVRTANRDAPFDEGFVHIVEIIDAVITRCDLSTERRE
jgi:hypothetical protein